MISTQSCWVVNITDDKENSENKSACTLADRVLQTLHLADRRGYGLTPAHISKMLVQGCSDEADMIRELKTMKRVSHSQGIYCLEGREHLLPRTIKKLKDNETAAKKYEALAMDFASEYTSMCPFIRCIAITGSMASGGFSEDDDIDYNIFVEKGTKYTTYLLGVFLSIKYSFRHRKKPLARKSATPFLPKLICINVIWEDYESLPFVRQDRYMAFELLRQKPVFGHRFYRSVLDKNLWLKTFFPQIYELDPCEVKVKRTLPGKLLRLFYSNPMISVMGERVCRGISGSLWRLVQFSRRNNPEALERVRWVTEMQKPYSLFGEML